MRCPGPSAGTLFTTRPPIAISPPVMFSSPAIMRSSVDFPQPEGPTRTTNSPSRICTSTPCRICVLPKFFRTLRTETSAMRPRALPGAPHWRGLRTRRGYTWAAAPCNHRRSANAVRRWTRGGGRRYGSAAFSRSDRHARSLSSARADPRRAHRARAARHRHVPAGLPDPRGGALRHAGRGAAHVGQLPARHLARAARGGAAVGPVRAPAAGLRGARALRSGVLRLRARGGCRRAYLAAAAAGARRLRRHGRLPRRGAGPLRRARDGTHGGDADARHGRGADPRADVGGWLLALGGWR
jgi:hypothetical protein